MYSLTKSASSIKNSSEWHKQKSIFLLKLKEEISQFPQSISTD